jgi:hypothetical protein
MLHLDGAFSEPLVLKSFVPSFLDPSPPSYSNFYRLQAANNTTLEPHIRHFVDGTTPKHGRRSHHSGAKSVPVVQALPPLDENRRSNLEKLDFLTNLFSGFIMQAGAGQIRRSPQFGMEGTDRISSISTVPPFCTVCQSFCLAWDQGLRSAAENGFSTLCDLFLGLKKKKAENFFDKDKEKTKEFFFFAVPSRKFIYGIGRWGEEDSGCR